MTRFPRVITLKRGVAEGFSQRSIHTLGMVDVWQGSLPNKTHATYDQRIVCARGSGITGIDERIQKWPSTNDDDDADGSSIVTWSVHHDEKGS